MESYQWQHESAAEEEPLHQGQGKESWREEGRLEMMQTSRRFRSAVGQTWMHQPSGPDHRKPGLFSHGSSLAHPNDRGEGGRRYVGNNSPVVHARYEAATTISRCGWLLGLQRFSLIVTNTQKLD